MVAITKSLAIFGLCQVLHARNVPSRTWERKEQAAALPTATLAADFKKNNVSAQWADGHPKQWGSEDIKYEYPLPPDAYWFAGTVSEDGKFVALSNGTHVKTIRTDTNVVVSEVGVPLSEIEQSVLLSRPNKTYDLIVARGDSSLIIHISSEGKIFGESRSIPGTLSPFGSKYTSQDGRLVLTILSAAQTVYAHDLDNPSWNLTLTGHRDSIMSAAYSPDSKYISTTSWDQTVRLYNATNGEFVRSFGPTGGQNWFTNFSPDGKYLLVATGNEKTMFWEVANPDAAPVVLPGYSWSRIAEWSPDSELVAGGSSGRIVVYSLKEKKTIQVWQDEDPWNSQIRVLNWFGESNSKKLAYRAQGGLEIYDFETNLKYRWGPGDFDHWSGSGSSTFILKDKGWIGGEEADLTMRFWKLPF